jgi:hypothetical protein
MPTKYTREVLEHLVSTSTTFAQVVRRLGLRPSGGNHAHIRRIIEEFALSTSHFIGQAYNRGRTFVSLRKHWSDILVLSTKRVKAKILRRAMIESGIPYKCALCENIGEWLGNPLGLEVDHLDGNFLDNRPENVRFLCPNCHAQTETYCARNVQKWCGVQELNLQAVLPAPEPKSGASANSANPA